MLIFKYRLKRKEHKHHSLSTRKEAIQVTIKITSKMIEP